MLFGDALALAKEARLIELALQRHVVAQHPLNRYPEGHPMYFPVPPRPDTDRGERLRAEANDFFREWFCAAPYPGPWRPGPGDPYDPQPGEEFVWRMNAVDYVPVVCADVKETGSFRAWYERLDDPVSEVKPAMRKPWYRPHDPRDLRSGRRPQ